MRNILFGISLLVLLAACQKEESMEATFNMEVKGFVEEECYTFGEPQAVYLWSTKSWADGTVTNVEYQVDPTLLDEYNKEKGTAYQLLPDSCYWMEQKDFNIDDEARHARFKVMYSPESIIASGGHYDSLEFALPMRLIVNGVPAETERGSVIVAFRVYEPLLSIQRSGFVDSVKVFDGSVYSLSMPFAVNYDNKEWINLTFEIDDEFVEEYNAENGTEYLPFPHDNPDYVTWVAEDGELERDVKKDSLMVYADMQAIQSGKQYMLAMKLSSISSTKAKIDPENFRRYVIFAEPPVVPYISQSRWTVTTTSLASGSAAGLADNNVNGDVTNSFWVWNWSTKKFPENIDYKLTRLDSLAVVSEIELWARRESTAWQGPKDMEIYVTRDGNTWDKVMDYHVELAEDGAVNTEPYRITFPSPIECVGVRIAITSMYSDGIGFNEIYMCGEMIPNPNAPEYFDILQNVWTVTTSSAAEGNGSVLNNNSRADRWLWNYRGSLPEDITYTLKDQNQTATVDSIWLYPSIGTNAGWHGPKDMTIQIDKDGSGTWEDVTTFQAPDLGGDAKWESGYCIDLGQSVECKAIRIRITSYWSDGIAFSEIVMYGKVE